MQLPLSHLAVSEGTERNVDVGYCLAGETEDDSTEDRAVYLCTFQ